MQSTAILHLDISRSILEMPHSAFCTAASPGVAPHKLNTTQGNLPIEILLPGDEFSFPGLCGHDDLYSIKLEIEECRIMQLMNSFEEETRGLLCNRFVVDCSSP